MYKTKKMLLFLLFILTFTMFVGCGSVSSKKENINDTENMPVSEAVSEEECTTEEIIVTENSENTETETTETVNNTTQTQMPDSTPNPAPPASKPQKEELKYTESLYEQGYVAGILYSVQLRDKPSESGTVLTTIKVYDELEVLGFCNELPWKKVRYDGVVGYIPDYVNGNFVLTAKKPSYADYYFTDGTIEEARQSSRWHYEGGKKYWVWVANAEEENGGHWDPKYEFCSGNSCSQELLIEFLDKYCTFPATGSNPIGPDGGYYYGQYDGEIYDYGEEACGPNVIMVIYLDGGPFKN